jgi:beta-glucosidase
LEKTAPPTFINNHQKVSSVTRPVKELKDFARVRFREGETKSVSFKVDASDLGVLGRDIKYKADPGVFELMVGASSSEPEGTELRVK